jgi:4-hydroxy-4-methyl-2-oxoglutarate aldolase
MTEKNVQPDVATLCSSLRKLPTAIISDVLAVMGLHECVLRHDIKPIEASATLAGPALCLLGREGEEPTVRPKPVFEMDRHVRQGCVAVIATGSHRVGAVVGGNVGVSFRTRGCSGIVTDGGVRDADEFREIGLPVFATFLTPLSNKGLWSLCEVDVPVKLPGQKDDDVAIYTGDLIHGDRDGVVVIPSKHAALVVAYAEVVERLEARIKQQIEAGEDREAVYAANDRFGHIRPVS